AILIIFALLCFLFTATATTEAYTLSLHDALPILRRRMVDLQVLDAVVQLAAAEVRQIVLEDPMGDPQSPQQVQQDAVLQARGRRSEEHTSELQSRENLVCRLLLEKKKKKQRRHES